MEVCNTSLSLSLSLCSLHEAIRCRQAFLLNDSFCANHDIPLARENTSLAPLLVPPPLLVDACRS